MPATETLASASVTARIANFLCDETTTAPSAEQDSIARMSLLDTLAVAIAGASEPQAQRVRRCIHESNTSTRGATVLGASARCTAESAAFANAVAAHVLDYDDVAPWLRGHPSVMIWPALLALAETEEIDIARMHSAFAKGMAALRAVAMVMAEPMYLRGWHTTSTLGTFGAAAACAYAARLSATATRHALGLAITQMAGLQQNFGTPAKPLQVGNGVVMALRSVTLARAGLSSPAFAVEGPSGAAALYAGVTDSAAFEPALHALTSGALALGSDSIQFKKYPMCYAAHRAIEAAFALRSHHGVQADDVMHLHVRMSHNATLPLRRAAPASGNDAQFSLEYGVARVLLDGQLGLGAFADEAVTHAACRALQQRITFSEDDSPPLPRYALLEARLHNGQKIQVRIDDVDSWLRAGPIAPALETKIIDCLQRGRLTDTAARAFIDQVMNLERGNAAQLLAGLSAVH